MIIESTNCLFFAIELICKNFLESTCLVERVGIKKETVENYCLQINYASNFSPLSLFFIFLYPSIHNGNIINAQLNIPRYLQATCTTHISPSLDTAQHTSKHTKLIIAFLRTGFESIFFSTYGSSLCTIPNINPTAVVIRARNSSIG